MQQRPCSSRLKKTISPDPQFTSGVNRDYSSRWLCYEDHPGWRSPKLQVPRSIVCPASQKFWKYCGIWLGVTSSGCQSQDFHTPHCQSTRLSLEANLHLGFPLPFRVTPTSCPLQETEHQAWQQLRIPVLSATPPLLMLCRATPL